MARVLSIEDKDPNVKSVITSRNKVYSDIDLTFAKRPSGDIYKKSDSAAVRQSVKNIIATGRLEKPFEEDFGADITSMFFELADDNSSQNVRESIDNALYIYEPRAEVLNIDVNLQPDRNSLSVTLTFKVISTEEVITLNTFVSRLR